MASECMILINGPQGAKFIVRAVDAVIAGLWDERDATLTKPCPVDIAALIPYRYRKAFQRNGTFWFDKAARIDATGTLIGGNPPHCELRDYRGRYMTTLYAIPAKGA